MYFSLTLEVMKIKILHLFISINLYRMFELFCTSVFQFKPYIRSSGKMLFLLSQKGHFILYNDKPVLLNKGVLLGLKISDFG